MSDDPFLTYDAAYVLGALSPDDRHAFEQHLRSCDQCAESVRELAGLPGLLARAEIVDPDESMEPPDLLPGLLSKSAREHRRRRWIASGGWIAAAAAAVGLVLVVVLQPAAPTPTVAQQEPMIPVTDTDVSATISVNGVTWGTKLELKCSYPAGDEQNERYKLVVFGRDQSKEDVGTWKVVPGKTATMAASTDIAADDIAKVEVQDATGHAVFVLPR